MIEILEIKDGQKKSDSCRLIIEQLPEWFGQPESNKKYIANIRTKDVFAAMVGDVAVGLIALHYHFQKSAEIWWMGIMPEYHGQKIGKSLFESAKNRTLGKDLHMMAVQTLSSRSSDVNYARTRDFYRSVGFSPFVEFNEEDPINPMMWMFLRL